MLKRIIDVILSAAGLLVLSPLLALLALLIRVVDGSPVLFRHRRVGRGGGDFTLLKFRTMTTRPGAESGAFDPGSSSRTTHLGRFLRGTKLDELPQIWNVLVGDMSLVGPRPEVRRWIEAYPERWARVLTVRPGITDRASIAFRNEEALLAGRPDPEAAYRDEVLPKKLSLYEEYVASHSVWGDLRILARTVWTVLKR